MDPPDAWSLAVSCQSLAGKPAVEEVSSKWMRVLFSLRRMVSVPKDSAFYPPLPVDALVAARGFGVDAGAHVYAGHLKRVRLGYGANVFVVRATQ